jgi:hypothetical protein
METKRINLTGNRSLINNKAHIDENWEKFSKNNSPYLRDALVPHYLKEESKNVASNIVFDKEGNKYYVDNDKFFVNDEAVADVSSTGFVKTDLEENYQCYDVNGPAYILDNACIYRGPIYQINYEIVFCRVRVINGNAYFVVVYFNEDNTLFQHLVVIQEDGTTTVDITPITWGQLVNGTTWTSVTDQGVVSSFRCNIGELPVNEGDAGVGITLIGNADASNKETDLYFFNSIYDVDEDKFFTGSAITWAGISGEQTLHNEWHTSYTITHKRTPSWRYDFSLAVITDDDDYNLYRSMGDAITITSPETAQSHTGVAQTFTLTYLDENNVSQTISAVMPANKNTCTLRKNTYGNLMWEDESHTNVIFGPDFQERINEMFNIVSLTVSQTINGVTYTKNIPVENITFNPNSDIEYWDEADVETSPPPVWHHVPSFSQDISSYKHIGQITYLSWEWDVTETFTAPSTLCNVFEDTGFLRSVPIYTFGSTNNIQRYTVMGKPFSITRDDEEVTLTFFVVREFKNTSTYTWFASSAYTFNQNYFDVLFCLADSGINDAKTHNFYNNSGLGREMIGDIGMMNDGTTPYERSSMRGKLWKSQYGAIAPYQETKWRLLYNYGNVSNISWGNEGEEGTILTDWNTIDGLFYISCSMTSIVYKDIVGIHKISVAPIIKNLQIFENNYVLINTTSYLNCYDIKAKKLVHFATDYNNRCYTGWQASAYGFFNQTGSWKATWEANTWENLNSAMSCASGQNVNYAISGSPFTSAIFPPQTLYHVVKGKEFYCYGNNASVDVYYNLLYVYTIKENAIKQVDSNLYPDAQYPISVNNVNYFNLPLLLTLIKTHNNKDMVKAGTMFYPIQYYNDVIPIFIYSTLGGLDGATDMFVIQAQFYAVMNGKICAVSYAENVVSNVEAIIDVSGMQFIGYLPTFALFYSPKNKNIYSFTGDANLEKIDDASEIGNLKHALYNSFTKTIHVITDKGVCIIGDTIYMIEFPGIEEIFFTENNSILETEDKIYKLSFNKLSDEYEVYPLIFETEFFGGLNDSVTTIYKWSMRFIKDSVANGKIKLSTVTLTDKGSETREKVYNVSNADWDKLTDSFYIQFCPENNKATGHKIRIESDFPLTSLIAQITTDGSLTAAKNTMKI